MKIARLILSDKGILLVTVFLLMIAAAFAFGGVMMQASSPHADLPLPSSIGNSITSYVMAGVMGKIPSAAGTFQSIGLFLAYIVTPFVVAIMLAARGSLKVEELDESLPIEDQDTAYAA
jgi:hypothetical protein